MKKLAKILTMLALLFSVCACNEESIDEKIAKASEHCKYANREDETLEALKICNNLYDKSFKKMSLEQKCDLAVLYYDIFSEFENDDVHYKEAGYKFMEVFNETMKNKQAARNYYERKYGDDFYVDVFELLYNASTMLEMAKNGMVDFEDLDFGF